MDKCYICGQDLWVHGQDVQYCSLPVTVYKDPITGQLTLHPSKDYEGESPAWIHPECSPPLTRMGFDQWQDAMAEIAQREAREEYDEEANIILQPEPEEDNCLWCKMPDYVWVKSTKQGMISRCDACKRYWNSDEEELAVGW